MTCALMRAFLALLLWFCLAGCAAKDSSPAAAGPMEAANAAQDAVVAMPLSHWLSNQGVQGMVYRNPSRSQPLPALVLVHDDYGLKPWLKEQAHRLAEKGYAVLAVDLYRGETITDLMDAHIMGRGLADDQALADLKAAVDFLAGRPWVRADAIGIIGWDIGGGYALDAAIHDRRLRAVVVCYGRLTTDPELLLPLHASVLGIFAGQDEGISAETIAQFRAAMGKAGKRLAGINVFPKCDHGFMNPAAPDPARAAIADAWSKIEAYLAGELKH